MALTRLVGANAISGTLPAANINNTSISSVTSLPAAIDTGSFVKLLSTSSTDVASVSVGSTYITTTYDQYYFFLRGKVQSDGRGIRVRYLFANGSEETGNYASVGSRIGNDGTYHNGTTTNFALNTDSTIGNAANESFTFSGYFSNPTSNIYTSHFYGNLLYATTGDSFRMDHIGARRNDGTAQHYGIKFYLTGGNFNNINLEVYGVTK